jgi:ribosomal protein S12 methylthiotransferase accessory factor
VAHGKGATLTDAKVSAMMEAVERYHAEHPRLPALFNSYDEIRYSHRVVDLNDLPLAPGVSPDPRREMLWVSGRELFTEEQLWLPIELVAHRPTVPTFPGAGTFRAGTTGLASGNELSEAMTHAICEVIERDARTLWRFQPKSQRPLTRIDPGTVEDETCGSVLKAIHEAELAVALYDATSDVGVATIVAHVIERNPQARVPFARAQGGGTHPCRKVALLRALTEALQARLVLIEGARDDLEQHHYRIREPHVLDKSRAEVLGGETPIRFEDVSTYDTNSFEEDLRWLMENLERAGLNQVIVVDLTREELNIPVVRVVVPGMEDAELATHYVPGPRLARVLKH